MTKREATYVANRLASFLHPVSVIEDGRGWGVHCDTRPIDWERVAEIKDDWVKKDELQRGKGIGY